MTDETTTNAEKQAAWGFAIDPESGRVMINVPVAGIFFATPDEARELAKQLNAHALAIESGVGRPQ